MLAVEAKYRPNSEGCVTEPEIPVKNKDNGKAKAVEVKVKAKIKTKRRTRLDCCVGRKD